MNGIYNRNMNYINNMSKEIYNKVKYTNISSVSICKSKNGELNILKKFKNADVPINSMYSPRKQAEFIAKYALKESKNVIFVFGLGMAYEIKEMLKIDNKRKYIIIEPDMELFKTMLNYVELKSFFNNSSDVNFILYDNCNDIVQNFNSLIAYEFNITMKFITLPAYAFIYKDLIDEVYAKVKDMINSVEVNILTQLYFHDKWYESLVSNIKQLNETVHVEELRNKFKGVPGIVIGAGPSLKYDLEVLKKIGDKAVIAAAGSGISVLETNLIKAHIWGAVDSGAGEAKIIENLNVNKNIILFYSTLVAPEIFSKELKYKFLMAVNNKDVYVKRKLKCNVTELFSGPSIANIMIYNLYRMGCNPIIFLGLDFCYSRNRTYAEGSTFYEEISEDKYTESQDYIKALNVNGQEVYTTAAFLSMKTSIENMITCSPEVNYFNGTKDGLNIKGAKNINFNDYYINQISKNKDINIDKNIISIYYNNVVSIRKKNIKLNDIIKKEVKNIIELVKRIIVYIEDEERKSNCNEDSIITFINELEKQLQAIELYRIIIFHDVSTIMYIYGEKSKIEKIKYKYLFTLHTCNYLQNFINNIKGEE